MSRPIQQRLADRLWREYGRLREIRSETPGASASQASSVSCNMPWTEACRQLAEGNMTSRDFRRHKAVRDVVETVGPVDGRFYAGLVRSWSPAWLNDRRIAAIDDWGNPLKCPGWLLGTQRAFSPTTLRYLATALWLQRDGLLGEGGEIVEIGVGFGGLAAANAVVSGAVTMPVDLPEVERAATLQMRELGLEEKMVSRVPSKGEFCFISNYAFTELNQELQDRYIETHVRHARCGMIMSNARTFSAGIGGRSNEQLLAALQAAGIPSRIDTESILLGPSDALCGNCLIVWK